MRIAYFCFITAACAALAGMALGIRMGMAQDFALAPVHAHLNLLGWVTMSLFGLYYRGASQMRGRLAWIAGRRRCARLPANDRRPRDLSVERIARGGAIRRAGSLLTFVSMALFLVVLLKDAVKVSPARSPVQLAA